MSEIIFLESQKSALFSFNKFSDEATKSEKVVTTQKKFLMNKDNQKKIITEFVKVVIDSVKQKKRDGEFEIILSFGKNYFCGGFLKEYVNEKKSMNTHLHLMEAYTTLFQVWPEQLLQKKLHQLEKN